ncbi:DUF1642 domain-containing protein [Cohnella zeiphila]|uniref:DUF1642 domain-containing protein n=1 Tax=Cohnella zeiphila TaxID=2761120 RepID=UPI003080B2AA
MKLPREVAEAMDKVKKHANPDILYDIEYMQTVCENNRWDAPKLQPIYDWYRQNKKEYLTALVNGYEVEQTMEDMLKKFFEENVNDQSQRSRGVCIGIIKTLDILGKFIEGVNVEWDAKNT